MRGLLGRRAGGDHISVKEAVLPFNRFPEADAILGPEMKSTGEVMGIDLRPGLAFAKSQIAAGAPLPDHGTVLMSLADRDKAAGVEMAQVFTRLGLSVAATSGTAAALSDAGVPVADVVAKVGEGGTDVVELIDSGRVQLVVNTPRGAGDHGPMAITSAGPPAATGCRCSPPPPPGWPRPTAWPTGPATNCECGPSRSTTAGSPAISWPSSCEFELVTRGDRKPSAGDRYRLGAAVQSGDDRLGHRRPRYRDGPLSGLRRSGRSGGQVAGPL